MKDHVLMRSLILAAFFAYFAWRNANSVNILRPKPLPDAYSAHGDCETVGKGELVYCEDAVFWDHVGDDNAVARRTVVLSCDPNRKNWNTVMGPLRDPEPYGALWLLAPGANPEKITLEGYPTHKDFHPLGIDIWPSTNGSKSNLFVTNHGRRRGTVEQFTLDPNEPTRAHWVRTISSRNIIAPNSIAMTSPTSFYLTNDHLLTRRLPSILGKVLPVVESLLALPLAFVNHIAIVDDKPGEAIIHYAWPAFAIPFANGIAISPDGATVAVASSSLGQINFYTRNVTNKKRSKLHLQNSVKLPFAPDNLSYDDDGTLYVAGHPSFPALVKLAANESETAPSWVVAISPRGGQQVSQFDTEAPLSISNYLSPSKSHLTETVYQSNGNGFSSSATALKDSISGTLYVTGLYADGILVCRG